MTSDAAISLAGALLARSSEADLIAATGFDVTPQQMREAFAKAVVRLKREQQVRIDQVVYESSKSGNRTATLDEEVSRAAFLLRTFTA